MPFILNLFALKLYFYLNSNNFIDFNCTLMLLVLKEIVC